MKHVLIASALIALAPIAALAQSDQQYQDPVISQYRQCQSDTATVNDYLQCAKNFLKNVVPGQYQDSMLHTINQEMLDVVNPNLPNNDNTDNTDVSTPPASNDDSGSSDQ